MWFFLTGWPYWGAGWTAFGVIVPPLFRMLYNIARHKAKLATAPDDRKYQVLWEKALEKPSAQEALDDIRSRCAGFTRGLKLARTRAASSPAFSVVERLAFWLGGSGIGRYGRTGKVCQRTANIDMLFDEAAVLNDFFFTYLERELELEDGELCAGPIKRPDRAFQKVPPSRWS